MVGLAGCGNNRDALTVQNRYTQMIQDHGDMFATNADGTKSDKVKVSYNSGEMKKLEDLSDNSSQFLTDYNLYARYAALKELQGDVLDNVFEYYVQQKNKFFLNFDAQEMEKDERKQLYNNIEKLEEDIETFKVARDKFDKAVDILTFKGIVKADITSYAYDYNMLIERCIEFVRYFKELNIKYFYSSDVNDVNYQEYIKHYYDETIFEINELYYYNYLKSFNNITECDLAKAYSISKDANDNSKLAFGLRNLGGYWDYNLNQLKTNVDFDNLSYVYSQITLDKIATFQQVRDMFMQRFRVYKTVYENMDYYKYNQAVIDGITDGKVDDEDSLNIYKSKCTNVEQANIVLVEEFYGEAVEYIKELKTLLNVSITIL